MSIQVVLFSSNEKPSWQPHLYSVSSQMQSWYSSVHLEKNQSRFNSYFYTPSKPVGIFCCLTGNENFALLKFSFTRFEHNFHSNLYSACHHHRNLLHTCKNTILEYWYRLHLENRRFDHIHFDRHTFHFLHCILVGTYTQRILLYCGRSSLRCFTSAELFFLKCLLFVHSRVIGLISIKSEHPKLSWRTGLSVTLIDIFTSKLITRISFNTSTNMFVVGGVSWNWELYTLNKAATTSATFGNLTM